MAPFVGGDDLPFWARLSPQELAAFETEPHDRYDECVPELPAELVEQLSDEAARYGAGEWIWTTDPDCTCSGGCLCGIDPTLRERTAAGIPRSLAAAFEREFRAGQRAKAASWRAAVALHDLVLAERGPLAAEHVGSELAVRMGVHPRTGMTLMCTALRAVKQVPRLVELVEAGCLSDRHVQVLLDEVGKWTDSDAQAQLVLEQTLVRCAERAERYGWPTPGEIKKVLQRVALLHDLRAADKRRKSVAERRGVGLQQTGPGAAMLSIEGPDLPLAYRAIQDRAEAMKHLEGDTRSREQREYDAAIELLTIDADLPIGGGVSARPSTGLLGEPLELVVRGAHVAVLTPYSLTQGGELELAEVPGFGYLLPSTTRELIETADSFTRVAVDAVTGEVLAVDDAIPGPDRAARRERHRARTAARAAAQSPEPDIDPREDPEPPHDRGDEDDGGDGGGGHDDGGGAGRDPDPPPVPPTPSGVSPEPETDQDTDDRDPDSPSVSIAVAQLRALADRKVIWRDLNTSGYRVPGRLRKLVEHRDRTCCFPGCTVPGRYCDVDHREEWPRGGTHPDNTHVLCRRHHRAKQFYFADVTLDPTTGDTCWTTFEGSTYRRPPPRY